MSTTEEAKSALDEASEVIKDLEPKDIAEMTRSMGTGLAAMAISLITGGIGVKKLRDAYRIIHAASEKSTP